MPASKIASPISRARGFLRGYRTYAICVSTILSTLVAWGDDQISTSQALEFLFEAISITFLRASVSNANGANGNGATPAAAAPGKPAPPVPPVPPALPLILLCVFLIPVAFGGFGCSALTPGLDTRTAAEARSTTSWDAESNLRLEENTTHNRRVVMAEGDSVSVEYQADGTPQKVMGATQVLSQCSEPHDVMEGYMLLAQKNAEVAAGLLNALQQVAALYQPVLIQRQQQQAARAEGNAAGAIATAEGIALLRDLLAEAGVLPEPTRPVPAGSTGPAGGPAGASSSTAGSGAEVGAPGGGADAAAAIKALIAELARAKAVRTGTAGTGATATQVAP